MWDGGGGSGGVRGLFGQFDNGDCDCGDVMSELAVYMHVFRGFMFRSRYVQRRPGMKLQRYVLRSVTRCGADILLREQQSAQLRHNVDEWQACISGSCSL